MENRSLAYWYVTSVQPPVLPWGRNGKAMFVLVAADDPDAKSPRIIEAVVSALSSRGPSRSVHAHAFVAERVSYPGSFVDMPPAWQADGFTVWSLDGPLTIPS